MVIEKATGKKLYNYLEESFWKPLGAENEAFWQVDSDDHDIDYFYESQLGSELTGAEDIHFHIIEPRTIRFSARYQFD